MEYDRHTPEQLNLIEKEFITDTLYAARQKLVARQGASEYVTEPLTTSKTRLDKETNIRYTHSFVTVGYDQYSGCGYHLSYAEDKESQFMYLDSRLQSNIVMQLLAKLDQKGTDGGIDAGLYLASIRRLDALSNGDTSTSNPSDLKSLIRYTQRIDTQYQSNDIDYLITKKIVVQELLDDQVLSEVVCGAHADDDVMDVSYEDDSGLFYLLSENLSYSDVPQDIPEMQAILQRLDLMPGE